MNRHHDTPELQAAMRRHEHLHKRSGAGASFIAALAIVAAGLMSAALLAHLFR